MARDRERIRLEEEHKAYCMRPQYTDTPHATPLRRRESFDVPFPPPPPAAMHSEGISWWRRGAARHVRVFSAYPPARLRSFWLLYGPPSLFLLPDRLSCARCAHDAAESDTHESSARAYTRSGAHLSRPPVTLSRILVAPPPCATLSLPPLPSAWPRDRRLSSLHPPTQAELQPATLHSAGNHRSGIVCVLRVLRARPCVSPAVLLLFLNRSPRFPAFPSPSYTLPLALFTTLPSLLFPFTELYLSSLSLASSLAAPLPTPRPSRVYPLCAGGCFFRLFVLASSRAGNRRRRRRRR